MTSHDDDETQIRQLVATWMTATQAGVIDTVLGLMTDDVVFLIPGRAPMDKAEFAKMARPQPGQLTPKFDGHSEIQEVQISGDMAFAWAQLQVHVTPPNGAPPIERAGHTLTVFRKQAGKWLLSRDANLLVTLPRPAA